MLSMILYGFFMLSTSSKLDSTVQLLFRLCYNYLSSNQGGIIFMKGSTSDHQFTRAKPTGCMHSLLKLEYKALHTNDPSFRTVVLYSTNFINRPVNHR